MYWTEDDQADAHQTSDDIVDLLFSIDCRSIPVDHAFILATELTRALPWISEEPQIAIHAIHVAGSQNGWERPEHRADNALMVSRRTKLRIRAPSSRADELLQGLNGVRLDLQGHPLTVGEGKSKRLSAETTLFARYLAATSDADSVLDEDRFLESAARELAAMNIKIRKALCGKATPLAISNGLLMTRSLLLSGLSKDESLRLQRSGLGPHRLMGCGIFIPHKGIEPVKSEH